MRGGRIHPHPFDRLRTGLILSLKGDLCVTAKYAIHPTRIAPIPRFRESRL